MTDLDAILRGVRSGELEVEEAKRRIEQTRSQIGGATLDLGFAQLDLEREKRTGFPEVIFGEGKTVEQIAEIFGRLTGYTDRVLATRIDETKAERLKEAVPGIRYHEAARMLTWVHPVAVAEEQRHIGYVAVVCAGTSDLPVAEEAAVTAESFGNRVERVYDVGVAGIHRLFRRLDLIRGANAIVVVAGMEGALASVVGGLVASPIVAVPTSIGYGTNLNGIAPLLSMLNACSPGIAVVNIDNGFGAGYYAGLINHRMRGSNE
jgi:pyridinium-3,5-biscarboxylic acid mononucleotide synthase